MMDSANSTFLEFYQQLNPSQKKAVDTIDGTVLVIAGPGTGKTQMLTLRIANILLKTDAKPENILALTFTEAGVAAMRSRLVSMIGVTAYRVNIFTFHGFSNYLIQTNPEDFQEYMDAQAVTDLEQVEILETVFKQNEFDVIKPLGAPYFYLQDAKRAISELKREGITPDAFEQILNQQQQDFDDNPDVYHQKGRYVGKMKGEYQKLEKSIRKNFELLEVYRMYQKALSQKNYYDFDDMLLTVIAHLASDEDLLLRFQEQYHYFLVDEHQDTNAAQNKIVELLASYHENPNLFAVGDEKQAIYRFQGASITNFLYFKKRYPEALLIRLEQNYRSTQMILDAADSLISHSSLPDSVHADLRVSLKAVSKNKSLPLQFVAVNDYYGEYQWIAQDVSKKISAQVSAEEIVVLGRTNRDLVEVSKAFAIHNIPHKLEVQTSILEDTLIQKFLLILRASVEYGNEEALFSLLCIDFYKIHPAKIFALQKNAKERKVSLWEALDGASKEKGSDRQLELTNLYEKLVYWHRLSNNRPADEVFTIILQDSGVLEQAVSSPKYHESVATLTTLYTVLRKKLEKNPRFTLIDFLQFIDLVEEHGLRIDSKKSSAEPNKVRLMTAHSSKGLEFEYVYIINAFDGKWGNKKGGYQLFALPYEYMGTVDTSLTTEDKNADDRRLFYVAITRAKKNVTISYAEQNLESKKMIPTQFVSEIDSSFLLNVETTTFNQAFFSKQKHQIFTVAQDRKNNSEEYVQSLKILLSESLSQSGLSATALNNYLSCPWRYFFRNVLRIPEAKTESLIFGSAIHESINTYIVKRNQINSLKYLLDYFNAYIDRQPLSDVQSRTLKKKGKDVFSIYYPDKMKHWPKNVKSEVKIQGVGIGDNIKIVGKLDMLVPGENKGEWHVYDFKTGKPKSRNWIEGNNKNTTGDYKRQLVFYQLLLNKHLGGARKMIEGVLEFVEPNETKKIVTERFTITQEETLTLEETIQKIVTEIRSLSFWDARCDDTACEYCRLRDMMGSNGTYS